MMFLSQITDDTPVSERLALGGKTLLLGFAAIFVILFIIYLFIKLQGIAFKLQEISDNTKKPEAVEAAPVKAPTPVAPAPVTAANDTELVAVIAAAISAYTGEPENKFRVVSFKRIK